MKKLKTATIETLIGAYVKTNTREIHCLHCDTKLEITPFQNQFNCPHCGQLIKVSYYGGDIS